MPSEKDGRLESLSSRPRILFAGEAANPSRQHKASVRKKGAVILATCHPSVGLRTTYSKKACTYK